MDILIKNLRFAFRSLRKNPGFTAVALVTLALGIGANTAIFSVVRGVVLSPLPYPDADRLVRVWPERPLSAEKVVAFQEEAGSFEALSGFGNTTQSLAGDGRPEEVSVGQVSPSHFAVVGVEPARGRAFVPEESQPGHGDVAILSHRLWQRRFGGDPGIVDRAIRLDGRATTVVGVMPEGHQSILPAWDVWVPITLEPGSEFYTDWAVFSLLGRLAPGVSIEGAQDETRSRIARLHEKDPDRVAPTDAENATVVSLLDRFVGDVRPTLWILFGAVGLVLLIACGNVANLMLAKANGRQREIAVRSALGAGRGRLVVQQLAESTLLALGGGLLGLLVASWTVAALAGQLSSSLLRTQEVRVDAAVLVFALGASLASGLLFGLVPALKSTRFDVQAALKSGGRGATQRHRLHHALVAAEIALSVVLVIGAGLLVKSFWQVQSEELGFDPRQVLTLHIVPPAAQYDDDAKRRIYFEAVTEKIAALPGVGSVGGINLMPMTGGDVKVPFVAADRALAPGERPPWTSVRMVTPELMETLRIPLLRGRRLTAADRDGAPSVGLVNRTLARQIWGVENPVGKRLDWDDGSPWFEVVGVVADIRQHRLDQATVPQVYRPIAQESWSQTLSFAVRSASDPAGSDPSALLPQIEQAIWSVDSNVPVTDVALMEQVVHRSLTDKRQLTGLFSLFAVLALVLGALGVYGVTAYTVSQRTHETGVRMALGATGGAVVRSSLGRVMVPVAAGLVLGLAASWGVTRLLESLLYEVAATDASVFFGVVLVLAATAALAGYLPARRAARVDPMVILGAD